MRPGYRPPQPSSLILFELLYCGHFLLLRTYMPLATSWRLSEQYVGVFRIIVTEWVDTKVERQAL